MWTATYLKQTENNMTKIAGHSLANVGGREGRLREACAEILQAGFAESCPTSPSLPNLEQDYLAPFGMEHKFMGLFQSLPRS